MITSYIEAHKERGVATINISGEYLHTENYKYAIMLLRGILVEFMATVDPKLYQKLVTTDKNGQTFLYVKVLNALYGLLRSALLFYRKKVKYLEAYVLNTNTYDQCIGN